MDDLEKSALEALDGHLASLAAELRDTREVLNPLLRNETRNGFFVIRGLQSMEAVERRYVLYVLEQCDSNKTQAAQILDVDASTLHRKLARWAGEDVARPASDDSHFPTG